VSRPQTSLASAAALITGARTIQTAVVFVLAMALSRGLTKSEYGLYQHAQMLASVIPLMLSVPLGKTVIYFLPRVAHKKAFLRRVGMLLVGVSIVVGLSVGLIPGLLEAFDDDPLFQSHRAPIGAIVGIAFVYTIAEHVMLARGGRRALFRMLLGVSAVLLFGVGGALLAAPEGMALHWVIRAVIAAYAFQAAVGFWWLVKDVPASDDDTPAHPADFRQVLAFVVPVALGTLIATLGNRLDLFVVPKLWPAAEFQGAKAVYFRGAMEIPVVGNDHAEPHRAGTVAPQRPG